MASQVLINLFHGIRISYLLAIARERYQNLPNDEKGKNEQKSYKFTLKTEIV